MRRIAYGVTALLGVVDRGAPARPDARHLRADLRGAHRARDEHTLARGIGWLSLGVGLSFMIAPETTAESFGMGRRRSLGRFLGAKDLAIGAGLLRSPAPKPWLLARSLSDAQDAALLLAGLASGAFPRNKAAFGLAVATGLCAASYSLARRLD